MPQNQKVTFISRALAELAKDHQALDLELDDVDEDAMILRDFIAKPCEPSLDTYLELVRD